MFKKLILAGLFSLSCHGVAVAGGPIGGSTELTQIANNFQLLAAYAEQSQQTITQFQQYQTMLQNLERSVPSALLDQAAQRLFVDQNMLQTFRNLQRVVVAGQQTSYSLSTIDQRFRQSYPGYGSTSQDYSRAYRDWSGNTLNSVRNSLALISAHAENFDSEQEMMNELMQRSQTANGQMQVVQAGNQIGVAMVGQMQQLRQLQMAQARAQGDYIAGQQSRQDGSDNALRGFFNRGTTRVRSLNEISTR